MHAERVDGNDVLAVRDATLRAVELARKEKLPSVLETISFRHRGHSVVDPDRYRSREFVEQGRAHDPVPAFGRALLDAGLLDENGLKQIEAQIDHTVERSVAFADESPDPDPKDLYVFDYATEVPNIDRTLPGDHTGMQSGSNDAAQGGR
jgi:pyruvate dehydrogenase E1 component alpha subunit